ncbi:MAG: hypothetical protein AAFO79_10430 [Pseudomonadota bacterium]
MILSRRNPGPPLFDLPARRRSFLAELCLGAIDRVQGTIQTPGNIVVCGRFTKGGAMVQARTAGMGAIVQAERDFGAVSNSGTGALTGFGKGLAKAVAGKAAHALDRWGALMAAGVVTWIAVSSVSIYTPATQDPVRRTSQAMASQAMASQATATMTAIASGQAQAGGGSVVAMTTDDADASGRSTPGSHRSPTDGILARESVLGAYSGVAYTHPSDTLEERPGAGTLALDDVEWIGLPYRNPIYYGARVAHWFQGLPVGGMVDFIHAKAVARNDQTVTVRERDVQGTTVPERSATLEQVYDKLEFSHGHNLLMLTGLVRLPFATARLSPYVGAGVGGSIPHVEIQRAGTEARTYGYQLSGWAAQGLVGVELRLQGNSVFIEYKFSFSPYRPALKDGQGGTLSTDLATHHAVGGFNLRLAH